MEARETIFYQHVNLNKADADELKTVPGISADTAKKIVDFRSKAGGFKRWEDLEKIPGFNKMFIDDLKKLGCSLNGGGI